MIRRVTTRLGLRRGARLALAATIVVLAFAVPGALAIHDFTDVPDANPFHADIAAIKRAGITSGKTCDPPGTPPTYCPNEVVNRQAMAAFMHRGFGRVAFSTANGSLVPPSFPTWQTFETVTIEVPGVPGQTQFVKLDAAVTASVSSTVGCPCSTAYRFFRDGAPGVQIGQEHYTQNEAIGAVSGLGFDSASITAVDVVPSGVAQTYRLQATRHPNVLGTVTVWGDLSAMTAPFGSAGSDVLGASTQAAPSTARPTRRPR